MQGISPENVQKINCMQLYSNKNSLETKQKSLTELEKSDTIKPSKRFRN